MFHGNVVVGPVQTPLQLAKEVLSLVRTGTISDVFTDAVVDGLVVLKLPPMAL